MLNSFSDWSQWWKSRQIGSVSPQTQHPTSLSSIRRFFLCSLFWRDFSCSHSLQIVIRVPFCLFQQLKSSTGSSLPQHLHRLNPGFAFFLFLICPLTCFKLTCCVCKTYISISFKLRPLILAFANCTMIFIFGLSSSLPINNENGQN